MTLSAGACDRCSADTPTVVESRSAAAAAAGGLDVDVDVCGMQLLLTTRPDNTTSIRLSLGAV